MQKLRQGMPVFVILMAIMFVALIVFEWGDARRGRGSINPHSRAIGSVNGQDISLAEYEKRVDDQIKQQRQQNPEAEVDDERIRQSVWDQLINEALIREAADKLGLSVSDAELREVFLYNPPDALKQQFTDSTGKFMQDLYFSFLNDVQGFLTQRGYKPEEARKIQDQVMQFQEAYRHDLLRQGVESVVTSTAIPSPVGVRAAFDEQRTKASGTFAFLPASAITDSIKVSEDEARTYFEKNRGDFFEKPSREMRYVLFTLNPSAQDSNIVKRRLKTVLDAIGRASTPADRDSLFAGFVEQYGAGKYPGSAYTPLQELSAELQNAVSTAQPGEVIGPVRLADGTYLVNVVEVKDSGEAYIKAQHILLKTEEGKNSDSVKAAAEKLYARAKGGEDFAKLAAENSADPGSAQRGGDLGYFKRGMMVKPFEDAAFAATPGSIVGPIKTDYGYHIIKVAERSSKSYKLRDLRFDVRISNTSKNLLRNRAQEFRRQLAEEGLSMDTLATRQNTQVLESGPIQRNQPAAGSQKLSAFAYTGKVGDVSEVVELPNGGYVVGQISKVRTSGTMEFADVKDRVIEKLTTQKKLDMLKARAAKLRASLAAGDSLSKLKMIDPAVEVMPYVGVTRSTPFPGIGFDYGLSASVFTMPTNQISQPIRGERGYFIVTVSERSQPSEAEFKKEQTDFTKQFASQKKGSLFQDWLQKMREQADIQDFRGGNR